MLTIDNYNEIKFRIPKIEERFEIQKGKRRAIYKVVESAIFEGYYDLIRCDNLGYSSGIYVWREKHLTGCQSVKKCVELAYDIT